MDASDLIAILPLIVPATASVVVMLAIAVYRSHLVTVILALLGLIGALLALPWAAAEVPRQVTPLLIVDSYALFYMGLLFVTSMAVILLSYGYFEGREEEVEEYYLLLLLATVGSAVLVASRHFASFFMGLEILSLSLYVLIAYVRTDQRCLEAAIKYLILAAVSAAFLLFGMALIYAELGTLEFTGFAPAAGELSPSRMLMAGLAMVVIGVGYKLAVVPFHMWTPDVYEGAPAPVTAFVATASKGGMLALLVRYFIETGTYASDSLLPVFTLIAAASMFVGNLLALLQDNVKRILAYSSIAHLGYLLVAFIAGGALSVKAVTFYLVAYFVTTVAAFGVITVLSGREREASALDDFRGLVWQRPWLGAIFAACMFSLAGIPLTAGFIGKFYVVASGVNAGLWLLVVLLVINSAIGIFYYLRIVFALCAQPLAGAGEPATAAVPSLSLAGGLVLAILGLVLLWLGVHPAPLIRIIETTVVSLV